MVTVWSLHSPTTEVEEPGVAADLPGTLWDPAHETAGSLSSVLATHEWGYRTSLHDPYFLCGIAEKAF